MSSAAFGETSIKPGRRNQYNAGLQQGLGRLLQLDADYFWKYTDNAYDFDTLFSTPVAFSDQLAQVQARWRRRAPEHARSQGIPGIHNHGSYPRPLLRTGDRRDYFSTHR